MISDGHGLREGTTGTAQALSHDLSDGMSDACAVVGSLWDDRGRTREFGCQSEPRHGDRRRGLPAECDRSIRKFTPRIPNTPDRQWTGESDGRFTRDHLTATAYDHPSWSVIRPYGSGRASRVPQW
jgi:hypothetical protein